MRVRVSRRGLLAAGAALAVAVAVAAVIAAFSPARNTPGRTFGWLVPRPAPAAWHQLTLPDGTAVLSYPPMLRPIDSDPGTVSAAQRSPDGAYLFYLNATPRQGDENLRHWAAFRLDRLLADDASSARRVAAATGLAFRGGSGSCVIDSYVTRIRAHHYQEIACLVQGRHGASVIVAAALAARWSQARRLLEQAVAAYSVR